MKRSFYLPNGKMALKLKQKELRKEIIKCKEIYKNFKATLSKIIWKKSGAESRKSQDIRSQILLFHQT